MIAQISTGEGFGGLVNYANDIAKKNTVIIASDGVNLSSNATITASFKAQAKARPSVHKYVLLREFARQNKEWADKADLIEYFPAAAKQTGSGIMGTGCLK